MKATKNHFVSVLVILGIAFAQFAYPQPASASRLCGAVTSTIYYVDANSPAATPDGCSWETAYLTLQDALTDATLASGNEVRVADGTYYPDQGAGQTDNDRESVFMLKNGVSVYGGYGGYGATDPDLRDTNPATNNTVLSGDIDGTPENNANNAYHVVGAVNISSVTRLSGFTLRDGHAAGANAFGGGLYASNASNNLKLEDLIFTNNSAYNGGGLTAIETELSLLRVKFTGNVSQNYGGGFYNQDGSPILLDVTFENNQTQIQSAPGAGMHSTDTVAASYTVAPVLTNVTFNNNSALQGGGGGMFNNNSNAILTNVTFNNNSASVRGGGMLNEGSNVVLNNVTFSGNTAPAGTGAAMRNIDASGSVHSAPVVKNTIFWETGGVDIVNDADNTITIDDSVIQDATCPTGGTCTNVTHNVSPLLSALADNGGFTRTMEIGLGGSAMDAGNNITCAAEDQRGVSRPQDGDENGTATCDIGAYEFEVGGLESTTTLITADTPEPSVVGQAVNVSVTVSGGTTTPTGTVNIAGANTNCVITLSGGAGNCSVNFTTAGGKSLLATYNGDSTHAASTDTEAHTVNKAATTTIITGNSPDPSVVGETVTVNFSVAVTSPGSGTPTGNVTVSDGVDSCVGTVAAETCELTLTTAGAKTLTATYAGDNNFATSTSAGVAQDVDKASTTTTITGDTPDPSALNQAVTVNFSVAVDSPGSGTPTGNVTVSDGVNNCVGTVAAGTCSITLSTLGARTLTATYAGDSNYTGSTSAGVPHTVNAGSTTTAITSDSPDPSAVGQAVTVNYSVTSSSGTPTGNVTVTDGVDSCVGTVAAGTCSITLTTAGTRILTASYEGDTNFGGSISVGVAHSVLQATDTVTTITMDLPDPSLVGQAVTVNFTVISISGTPTGNVTVTDGVNNCVGTVAAGTCNISLTTVGKRTLTATYAGDSNFSGSTSPGVAHLVIARITMRSMAAQDGWLLESGENTNKGNTLNSAATTFFLGDNAQRKQYRSVLSFSTKGLPDKAVITKLTLKVKKQGVAGGGNPVNAFQGFMVDFKRGFFGSAPALQGSDFQAFTNKSYGPFKPALKNGWYTISLTPAKAYINKLATGGGVTQIRLRFNLDDNNNNIANYLSLYSGNAPAASRPQLVIEYYVP